VGFGGANHPDELIALTVPALHKAQVLTGIFPIQITQGRTGIDEMIRLTTVPLDVIAAKSVNQFNSNSSLRHY